MGEWSDQWPDERRNNVWGAIPKVVVHRQAHPQSERRSVSNPSAFERANYVRVLSSYALNPRPGRS